MGAVTGTLPQPIDSTNLCGGASSSGGTPGTVTLTDNWVAAPEFLVNGSPFVTIPLPGTLLHTKVVQADHTVWKAAPGGGIPTFQLLTVGDIPDLGSLYWKLTGNLGTVPGTNYIGTNDNQAWMVKTNLIEAMRVFTPVTTHPGHVTFGAPADYAQLSVNRTLDYTDPSTYKGISITQDISNVAGADSGTGAGDGPRVAQFNQTQSAARSVANSFTWNLVASTNFRHTGALGSVENSSFSSYQNFGGGYTASGGHAGFARALQVGDGSQRALGIESVIQKPRYQSDDTSLMADVQMIGFESNINSEVAVTTSSINAGYVASAFKVPPMGTSVRQGTAFLVNGDPGANWTYPFHYRDSLDWSIGTTAIAAADKFRVDWTGLTFQRFAVISPDAASSGTGYGDALTITEDQAQQTGNIVTIETSKRTVNQGIYVRHQTTTWATGSVIGIDAASDGAGAASGTFTGNFIQCTKDGYATGANLKFWVEPNGNSRSRFLDIGPRVDGYVASPANIASISDEHYLAGTGDNFVNYTARTGSHSVFYGRQDVGTFSGSFFRAQSDTTAGGAAGTGAFSGYYILCQNAGTVNKFFVNYDGVTYLGNVAGAPAAPVSGCILYSSAGHLYALRPGGAPVDLTP